MVVGLLAGKTNASPASAASNIGIVDAHISSTILDTDQAVLLGRALIDVCYVAVCGIARLI